MNGILQQCINMKGTYLHNKRRS